MIGQNIIKKTDSYKVSHYKQYPPKTTKVFSYIESRGGMFKEVVFFGLQYILKRHFTNKITMQDTEEAQKFWDAHLGEGVFNKQLWEHIVLDHDGKLPLHIKAVEEGSVVPTNNVLVTVENTCDKCFWLTSYMETILMQIWYPITVATLSREMKKIILYGLKKTGNPSLIDFKLHDFGYRGVSSFESAAIGGASHLVNFQGTDTVAGLELLKKYYNSEMAGFSIPAAEHSTMTAWGQENEEKAFKNMLTQFPKGLVACVSDSYNIYEASEKVWGEKLKKDVLARDGTLVIRPDSGIPHEVVLKVIEILGNKFGYTINSKGYKVLNDKVRVIQGDGIDYKETRLIINTLIKNKWSIDNIAFGMGGALLQKLNRDTQHFAMKCSSVTVDGKQKDVWKNPVGVPLKKSKSGELKLIKENNTFHTVKLNEEGENLLQTVYLNGKLMRKDTLVNIRKRAEVNK